MDIYCTRPRCEQPLNSFPDLDDRQLLKTLERKCCAHCELPLILNRRYVAVKLLKQSEWTATFLGYDLHAPERERCTIEQLHSDPNFNTTQVDIVTKLFELEAEVLGKLGAHPKIPRLLDRIDVTAAAEGNYPTQKLFYLVQEYIDGQSLRSELLAKGQFTESEVIFVLREVARTLEFVHFQDTIHRNIKPSHIIRDLQGKIYLVDFGSVKQIVAETLRATQGGIDNHVAPADVFVSAPIHWQQYQGQTIYPSSDLYSLAVTCLNLLTGKNPQDLLDANNNWHWRTPDLQVSDALAAILDKMLQKLPSARFQSARDVLDSLDETCGVPTLSIPSTSIAAANMSSGSTLLLTNIEPDPDPLQFEDDLLQFDEDFLQFEKELLQLDSAPLQIYNQPAPIVEQKPIRKWKPWLIAGVLATSVVGLMAAIVPKISQPTNHVAKIENDAISRRSSTGERILFSLEGNKDTDKFKELKRAGVLAIANKNYPEAIVKLQAALSENPNSPETRIYLNNALIGDRKSYTIAAAAPISRSIDRASEMLRGFAQAQAEINQVGAVNEAKIKLRIVDDGDDPKTIESIANAVVERPDILGIVGHSRNDVSIKAAEIYNRNQLSFVAPIGTANKLTSPAKPYIFRTNSKGDAIAQKLVDRIVDTDRKRRVAIFYIPTIAANDEFKTQFVNKLTARGGEVVKAFPFSTVSSSASPAPAVAPVFDAEAHLEEANALGADTILLLSVGRSNREALKILKIKATKYPNFSVFGDTALYSMNTLKAGKETEGLILGVPWQESESTPQFSTGAKQLWNDRVNWATATSYNAVKALGTAIKAQETPSREGVREMLSKNEFMGASGRFQFKNGEPTERYVLVKVAPTPPDYKYSSKTGYDFVPIEDWWF